VGQPRRPDQRPQEPVPYTPGSRSGGVVQVTNLATSGLALETTTQAINTTLGSPAQETTQVALLSQVANAGAQPFVPGLQSANSLRKGAQVATAFYTFTANARIWRVGLQYSACAYTGYTGPNSFFSTVSTGGGVTLAVVELSLGTLGQIQGNDPAALPGLPVLSGDTLLLNVNNNTTVTDTSQRASVTVLFSVP
jgi:hypothetical protein